MAVRGTGRMHVLMSFEQGSRNALLKSDGKISGNLRCPAGEHLVDAVVFLIKYSAPVGC